MRGHRAALAVTAALALGASLATEAAQAHRLSLTRAESVADAAAEEIMDAWIDEDEVVIDDYEVGTCDRLSDHKVDCEVTYSFDDGDSCDDVVHMRFKNARSRTVVYFSDSDAEDGNEFSNCTGPADDDIDDDIDYEDFR